jgi:hypothetical protein
MPIEVYWDDPAHTILITEYRGYWTEADVFQAVDQGVSLAATSAAPRLDNINDLLCSETPLFSRNLFRLTAYARPRLPGHLGVLVMVTSWANSDLALKAQALALGRERGFVRHAWTLDEARALIAHLRQAEHSPGAE